MSKWDKLIRKICSLSNDIILEDLQKVLEHYGYVMKQPKKGSSHYVFRKKGHCPITIPKHKPIKQVYVKKVRDIIENEERGESDEN